MQPEPKNSTKGRGVSRQQNLNGLAEIASSFGKLPPQNLEAEEAVLGAMMLEKEAYSVVTEILQADSFYKEAHRVIFEAMVELDCKGDSIDLLTVTNRLRKTTQLDFIGGPFYLVELTQRVSSAANLEYHCRIVLENAVKRDLIKISSNLTRESFDYTSDIHELLETSQQSLFAITEKTIKRKPRTAKEILKIAQAEMEARQNSTNLVTGVPSGFTDLDRRTGGWQKTDLIIIAARPGMGKTALILSCLKNACLNFKKPVAMFSLEMSNIQLMCRLISMTAEIPLEIVTKGKMDAGYWLNYQNVHGELSMAPMYLDDTPALSIMELRAKARQLKLQYDIQLVIIDYLQLMRGLENSKSSNNREQEIASISRELKALAKELDVPVIALSQLSRATEQRGGDKRPMLSDLRESGAIEQDADMVMFLYRPEYYGIEVDEENIPTKGIGEVIIAKHRNGSLDTVKLRFIGQFTKFTDLDHSYTEPVEEKKKDNWNAFPQQSQPSLLNDLTNFKSEEKKQNDAPF